MKDVKNIASCSNLFAVYAFHHNGKFIYTYIPVVCIAVLKNKNADESIEPMVCIKQSIVPARYGVINKLGNEFIFHDLETLSAEQVEERNKATESRLLSEQQ